MKLRTLKHIIHPAARLTRDERMIGDQAFSQTWKRWDTNYEVMVTPLTAPGTHGTLEQLIEVRAGVQARTYIACGCGEIFSGIDYAETLRLVREHLD